jgi:hypothetical protein
METAWRQAILYLVLAATLMALAYLTIEYGP